LLRVHNSVLAVVLIAMTLTAGQLRGELRLTATDDRGVTFEYIPEPAKPVEVDGVVVRLSIKNADAIHIPGKPELPVRTVTIAVPPGSKPSVRLLRRQPGQVWDGSLSRYQPRTAETLPEAVVYSPSVGEVVGPLELRTLGGLQVARVPIYPVRISDNPPRVELTERITVRLDFNAPPTIDESRPVRVNRVARLVILNCDQAAGWSRVTTSNFREPSWPQGYLYRFEIDQEGIYRLTFDELARKGVELPEGLPSSHLKLFGNGGGELPLEPDAEAPLGLEECAIYVYDDNLNGRFDNGDWLLFYGRGAGGWAPDTSRGWRYLVNHYAVSNIYWLNIDPAGGGLRMESFHKEELEEAQDIVSNTGLVRFYYEPERFIYHPGGITGSGREWYGHNLTGASRISFTLTTDSPDTTLPAVLGLRLVNTSSRVRSWVEASLNGIELGGFPPGTATSLREHRFEGIQSLLRDGFNSLVLNQTIGNAQAMFDWLELAYRARLEPPRTFEEISFTGTVRYDLSGQNAPWAFNITDHNRVGLERKSSFTVVQDARAPRRYITLTPADFQSVSSSFEEYFPPESDIPDTLWSGSNRADVLLITPDNYRNTVEPLLDYYARRDAALTAARVRLSEIYNYFSGGLRDPAAIRNFLMVSQERWARAPDFVLFCGDGDYNFRDISRPRDENRLPPYEMGGLCTDDWFVDFTPRSEDHSSVPLPEMVHGRLTGGSDREIRFIVDKIIAYVEEPEFGHWRNRVTLVADDEFGESYNSEAEHVQYTEDISNHRIPAFIDQVKIYLTEYPRQWGRVKPQAGDDLVESINNGTLLVNYMGHGNPTLWSHEHVFVQSRDMSRIEESRRWPAFIAFTCDWAYWDDASSQSFAEQLLALPDRGAIAIVASSRLTGGGPNFNLATNFFTYLFEPDTTIGEALVLAKHLYRSSNSASYHLLGDPTMFLGHPRLSGHFTHPEPDTLTPLALSTVEGEINGPNGEFDPAFFGELDFLVRDTRVLHHYEVEREPGNPIHLYYYLPGPTVYRGLLSVSNGSFVGQFIVPRDVTLGSDLGRVVGYFHNDETDGVIALDSVAYAELVAEADDTDPPHIRVFFNHRGYREGDIIGPEPLLIVDLTDSSGLNLTGAMGHGIGLIIDASRSIDLTPHFQYDLDSHQSGSLERRIGPLEPGWHLLDIHAWDSFNNLVVKEFEVEVTSEAGGLIVDRVYNYPNPFRKSTQLTFFISEPADFEVTIYTVGGRRIWDHRGRAESAGLNAEAVWNGHDRAGRSVANGVYLYRVVAWDTEGRRAEGLGRIVYAR